ncbi:hypothetical protein BJP34_19855 [Moorena producens PAL-8-15-08-1]|uniref:Uncharacterized protein n=1 Tax=Moorena producens PAL-8-15-08-1 TaxID=1458985 RepID=A0A1D8TV32_9CYAN|nr:hypothetical protein [Moorena producens]AOX01393.1 hypothetical protein BJP34_19855 [Moorena producens PAL-8-15-08-1]
MGRWLIAREATVNLQPTCNLQPTTCNLQPATCNLKPETWKLQPKPFTLRRILLNVVIKKPGQDRENC